ncbi:hypothetical protein [Pseudonocardia alaniniphila]|uniref:DUF8175 domain-containing protein n=1 Tax=Pseudonocardia alaniniphila TaxID=75291 RepID=A0ABS9T9K0_9PSEU|nr:hypothetical protein [Pseudonocardia alaniniphila]MCH6165213.1 hypothetical protein [Pseudonocardia alaniniphila]
MTKRLLPPAIAATVVLAAAVGCSTTPSPEEPTSDAVVLVAVPGGVGASSLRHGPFHEFNGRATGFSHDGVGAALAATHIGARTASVAGSDAVAATLDEQCWGDVARARERLFTALPRPDAPSRDMVSATAMYFRVIAGDARGEFVVLSLLADTPQARALGGFSRVDATMRWSGLDWQLRVPVPRPSVYPDTTGYRLLGPTQ